MGENYRKALMAQLHIKRGRELLRQIGADKAAERVNGALKSVDGARRHAWGKDLRVDALSRVL